MTDSCRAIVQHLNRIQGQIDALKDRIDRDPDCEAVLRQTRAITKSFASVQHAIARELLSHGGRTNPDSLAQFERALTLLYS